jgi:exonuclease VII small subunit
MDRVEATLERSTQLLERVINVQESQQNQLGTVQNQIEILVRAMTSHEAMISRLDGILERLIYREGREDSP